MQSNGKEGPPCFRTVIRATLAGALNTSRAWHSLPVVGRTRRKHDAAEEPYLSSTCGSAARLLRDASPRQHRPDVADGAALAAVAALPPRNALGVRQPSAAHQRRPPLEQRLHLAGWRGAHHRLQARARRVVCWIAAAFLLCMAITICQ